MYNVDVYFKLNFSYNKHDRSKIQMQHVIILYRPPIHDCIKYEIRRKHKKNLKTNRVLVGSFPINEVQLS